MEKMNIYQKLQKMRVALQKKGLKKSGLNDHKRYEYFELADFLPYINEIQEEYNTITLFELREKEAVLKLVDCDKEDSKLEFALPTAELTIAGANTIQNIGGLTTYCRRYLYMIAFEIAENDEFDVPPPKEPEQPVYYVDEVKVKVLRDKMQKKGVTDEQVLERYSANSIEELTVLDFMKACSGLDKMPDVEQVNIF